MNFDWLEFLTLAMQLTEKRPISVTDEALWRCSISRAYYTVYHRALERALRDGYRQPYDTGAYEALINYYRTRPDYRWREIGESIEDLREMRVKADYHRFPRHPSITENLTRLYLALINDVLNDLNRL